MDYRYHLQRTSHVPLTNRKDCWCRVKGARQLQESPNPPPSLSLLLRRPLGMSEGESAGSKLLSVDFEIFGHVQGSYVFTLLPPPPLVRLAAPSAVN